MVKSRQMGVPHSGMVGMASSGLSFTGEFCMCTWKGLPNPDSIRHWGGQVLTSMLPLQQLAHLSYYTFAACSRASQEA